MKPIRYWLCRRRQQITKYEHFDQAHKLSRQHNKKQ